MSISLNGDVHGSGVPSPRPAVPTDTTRPAATSGVYWSGVQVPQLPRVRVPRWRRTQLAGVVLSDLVTISGVFATVSLTLGRGDGGYRNVAGGLFLCIAWLVAAVGNGAYDPRALGSGVQEHKRVLNAGLHLTALVGVASALPGQADLRAFLVPAAAGAVAVLVARHVDNLVLALARRHGFAVRRVLVIGEPSAAFPLASRIERSRSRGLHVVGVCSTGGVDRRGGTSDAAAERRRGAQLQVLGTLESAAMLARREAVDIVAVAHSHGMSSDDLRALSWQLEDSHVEMLVAPALVDVAGPRITVEPVAGLPLLHIAKPEFSLLRRLIKGSVDRILAAAGLLALSPVLLGIAVLVRRDSAGPVLFRQRRVGQGGHEFEILKFRSMYLDAEARLEAIATQNQHGEGPLFKMRDDPRITRVGQVLRRWSLDELPQLINVLRGQMSLVGPRPPLPREVAAYDKAAIFRRLMVKPGLTGLWQVSGRADLSWQEAVRLDLYYVENWSPALDFGILWRTLGAVTKGSGAY